MVDTSSKLSKIFDGWKDYQTSIMHVIQPLTQGQLAWRPAPKLRSVGELASRIVFGRVGWFARMQGVSLPELEDPGGHITRSLLAEEPWYMD